jgi:hypothetical protein
MRLIRFEAIDRSKCLDKLLELGYKSSWRPYALTILVEIYCIREDAPNIIEALDGLAKHVSTVIL